MLIRTNIASKFGGVERGYAPLLPCFMSFAMQFFKEMPAK